MSEAPAEFEFDLSRLTVSSSGNDPLGQKNGDAASQADSGSTSFGGGGVGGVGGVGGGCSSCDVQVSPGKAVAPPTGSVRCTVRG